MTKKCHLNLRFLFVLFLLTVSFTESLALSTIRLYCVDESNSSEKIFLDGRTSLKISAEFSKERNAYLVDQNMYAYLMLHCRKKVSEKNTRVSKLMASNSSEYETMAKRVLLLPRKDDFIDPWEVLTEDDLEWEDEEPFPFLVEEEQEGIKPAFGQRSMVMHQNLLQGGGNDKVISFQGRQYTVITGNTTRFAFEPVASIGAGVDTREIITIDGTDQEALDSLYGHFLDDVRARVEGYGFDQLVDQKILELLKHFLSYKVFIFPDQVKVAQISSSYLEQGKALHLNGSSVAVIPIREFLSRQVGLCRHVALVFAYMVSRLQQEGFLLDGGIHIQRDTIQYLDMRAGFPRQMTQGHAWNIFAYKNGEKVFHIDSMWNILEDVRSDVALPELVSLYGAGPIRRERKRYGISSALPRLGAVPGLPPRP